VVNSIPYLLGKDLLNFNRLILNLLIPIALLTLLAFVLSMSGYKLKGFYAYKILGLGSIVTSILFLATEKKIKLKIIANFLLIPLMLIGVYNTLLYHKTGTYKLNADLDLVVSQEGFLGCGETLRITQTQFLIFDKELKIDSRQCLKGITEIEPLEVNDQSIELLIYHDGVNDSENPYHHKMQNENDW